MTQRRERGDAGGAGGDRDQAGERVLARAETRAAVHERVVERVHEGKGDGGAEHRRLARSEGGHRSASSKKPTTRRSYSCGRASNPPVCVDSGISHSVAESPADFA
jgi:hypothetical protein